MSSSTTVTTTASNTTSAGPALAPNVILKNVGVSALRGFLIGLLLTIGLTMVTGSGLKMLWQLAFAGAVCGAIDALRHPLRPFVSSLLTLATFLFAFLSMNFMIIMATGHAPMDGWEAFTQTQGPTTFVSSNAPHEAMIWFMLLGILVWISSNVANKKALVHTGFFLFGVCLAAFVANRYYHGMAYVPQPEYEHVWQREAEMSVGKYSDEIVAKAQAQYAVDHNLDALKNTIANEQERLEEARKKPIRNGENPTQPSTTTQTGVHKDYRVLNANLSNNEYEYQLDASISRQRLTDDQGNIVFVGGGDTIQLEASGKACDSQNRCTGPQGETGQIFPKDAPAQYNPDQFPVQDAYPGELVAYMGTQKIRIGAGRTYQVPTGAPPTPIELGINNRVNEAAYNKEGHHVKIKVSRKT